MLTNPAAKRSARRGPAPPAVSIAITLALLLAGPAHGGPIEDRLQDGLSGLDARELQTGVLYDRVLPLSGIERFSGAAGAATASRGLWSQIYEEMRRASADPSRRPTAGAVIERARLRSDAVPLTLLFDRYERIRPDAVARGALRIENGRLVRGAGQAFETHTAFAAAALRPWTYRGSEVRFVLASGDYFSNRDGAPPALETDLGDGLGFRALRFDVPLTARYAETGTKTLRVRATTADGEVREAALSFAVRSLATPTPNDTLHVTGTISYLGGVASGDAYEYLAAGRTRLVNPIVVPEGFDIDNSMNWDELYAELDQQSLIEDLRAAGYDAVVLNFTDATDYLQRNAFVLVELLRQIHATLAPQASVALAGPSMGGLLGRFALAYMETHGMPHGVRIFLSLDGPHLGADIPLGIQYWMNFFSSQSAEAASLLAALNRPASRQMLVYHYTDPPAGPAPDPLRGTFQSDLAAAGNWPSQPRKVAIANGSDHGAGQGFAPGAQVIEWSYNSLSVGILGNVWAVPNLTSTKIFDGSIRFLFIGNSQSVTVSGSQPYDNAPGGSRATMAEMDSVAAPYGDIVALYPSHCFIPTVSALAYNTSDLFHNISADPNPRAQTPFDAIYTQATNQEHVAITTQNAGWIRNEIEAGGVTTVGPVADGRPGLRAPIPNPSSGAVRLDFTLRRAGAVDLSVFGVDGREVARLARGVWEAGSHEVVWNGRDARGTEVGAGIYFVRLAADGAVVTRRIARFR